MRKKPKILVIASMIMLMTMSKSYASSGFINIKLDKKPMEVREVPVILDGKNINSEVPSFLYVDRTLVPARLISENYGAKVGWEKKTEKVTVEYNGEKAEFQINSNKAKVNGQARTLDTYSVPKLVNFGGSSAVTMVPLNFLGEILNYETEWDPVNKLAYIKEKASLIDFEEDETGDLAKDQGEKEPEASKPEEDPKGESEEVSKPDVEKKDYNKIESIVVEEKDGDSVLLVKGRKNVKYNILRLENPNRIVIDFLDSILDRDEVYVDYDYKLGVIDGVRMSQFSPDKNYKPDDKIVRVVLDIKYGDSNSELKVSERNGDFLLKPEKSFWDNINYNPGDRTLTIKKKYNSKEDISYDKRLKRLNITLDKDSVDLNTGSKKVVDSILGQIDISKDSSKTKISLRTRSLALYDVVENSDSLLKVKLRKDDNVKNSDRTIVIDPGHGGSRPGTISLTGMKEKDLTLGVALKLKSKLESNGYNVLMTRETDIQLAPDNKDDLINRAELANKNSADVFISIHGNAFSGNSSIKGIETYHYSNEGDHIKKDQQVDLAKYIQNKMLQHTGASSRGVKAANFSVLRNSSMPGVLIELGFLSNPEEDRLLNSDQYRDKLANGIVEGLENYFKKY